LQLFGNTSNNNAFRISILAALPPALFFLALKNEACRAILGQKSRLEAGAPRFRKRFAL